MISCQNKPKDLKAIYYTLGCKLNFSETSTIEGLLRARGIEPAQGKEIPDIVVVNTCSVTAEAGHKSIRAIKSYHKKFPKAAIIVTGCHAQLNPDELSGIEGVKLLLGNDRKQLAAEFIDELLSSKTEIRTDTIPAKEFRRFESSCSRGERTRYFLKVQDGCDYWCSYCTIPKARGRSRSPKIEDLVAQADIAAREGGKEIVLTGVNIGDFGKGSDETFLDLIKALEKVEGIERYRISSIEPNLLSDEIITYCAESHKFMPHFHIPLQSGDDEVLQLMRRHYDTSKFRSKIERIRSLIPDAFIGVDLIVGARGETEERFLRSKAFVESLDISRLHVFTYSERADTAALKILPVVSQEEKHRRTREMLKVSSAKLDGFFKKFEGTSRPVLVEHPKGEKSAGGFTDNYLRVIITTPLTAEQKIKLDNKIVPVKLGAGDPETETIEGTLLL